MSLCSGAMCVTYVHFMDLVHHQVAFQVTYSCFISFIICLVIEMNTVGKEFKSKI